MSGQVAPTHDQLWILQVKEHHVVQTEMLRNRTHQSFRWKDTHLATNRAALERLASDIYTDPRIEWRIVPRTEWRVKPSGEEGVAR